ncbi:hypothetical protein NDU88_006079 [Pleurodeles waltl]|uniref:Uncharacterized protein n=1 Tax=Pleurodeles waltl TaxID=8319 RepID=A0AAV7RQY8_PLEWA|nr:hypothetical protein NDU88_006079 [Pleurodeles waltl]
MQSFTSAPSARLVGRQRDAEDSSVEHSARQNRHEKLASAGRWVKIARTTKMKDPFPERLLLPSNVAANKHDLYALSYEKYLLRSQNLVRPCQR